jgi:hypothetical protein
MKTTKYRARIETTVNGKRVCLPVLPKAKKTSLFASQDAAVKALCAMNLEGRGFVYPSNMNYAEFYNGKTDWSNIYTIAL